MLKYFDNTFFKFFFGFLGILFFSLVVLVASRYLVPEEKPTMIDIPLQAQNLQE